MDIAALVTVLIQLGVATAAYRLASKLTARVMEHEKRIGVLETVKG